MSPLSQWCPKCHPETDGDNGAVAASLQYVEVVEWKVTSENVSSLDDNVFVQQELTIYYGSILSVL